MDAHDNEATQTTPDVDEPVLPPKIATRKPLPVVQLIILNLVLFTEPVTSTVIYPFVNQFVQSTGITRGDEKRTGYYAGVIESVFFLSECLSVYHWGSLSDRIGRRPVLLLGPLGLSLAMASFGLSAKFWTLFVSRCAQGVFNGNIGAAKSMIVEITDPVDVPLVLSWYPAVWSAGITLGPIIGGATANPALRWPDMLGNNPFFRNYPYFLPCAIAGMVAFSTFLYAYFFLRESLPAAIERDIRTKQKRVVTHQRTNSYKNDTKMPLLEPDCPTAEYGTTSGGGSCDIIEASELNSSTQKRTDTTSPTPLQSLLTRSILISLTNHAFFSFLDQSHQVLFPLMLSTSIPLGGLGFSPFTIGMIMGTWGITNAIFQVIMFARVIRWFGPRKAFITFFACFLSTFSAYPLMGYLAKRSGRVGVEVWIVLCIQLFLHFFAYMSYSCCQIFVLDAAPPGSLGAVNGLGQMTSATVRTIAPTLASSLFSVSLEKHLLGGYMVFLVIVCIALVGCSMSLLLPRSLKGQLKQL